MPTRASKTGKKRDFTQIAMASPKLKIALSTIWTVISLWISYAKEKWYWAFIVAFYKLGEDALLGWINQQWGVAMTYLNYVPPATGYFLIPLIFLILLFKTYRQVTAEIERTGGFMPIERLRASIQSDARTRPARDLIETANRQIKITEEINNDDIVGVFFNDSGSKLQCSIWIMDLREWTTRHGYLDTGKFKPSCLVRNATIWPERRYDTYTRLIYRDAGRRLCVRGHVDGHDREQHFDAPYPENIWTLTVEVKIESESEEEALVARKHISFTVPAKGFELTANPESKRP